jgi:hypothetical protein
MANAAITCLLKARDQLFGKAQERNNSPQSAFFLRAGG